CRELHFFLTRRSSDLGASSFPTTTRILTARNRTGTLRVFTKGISMPFARKVLWIVDYDSNPNLFADYARNSGCDTLCIRTWSDRLQAAIPVLHHAGKTVWAWRWP